MRLLGNISFSCLLLLLTACGGKKNNDIAPWGDERESDVYDLDEILSSGGIIAVTLNGPDTYYDYRGSASGTQYRLCELFALHIGLPLRMEVCRDTAELIRRVTDGSADLIACTINSKDCSSLRYCGVTIDGRGQWAVNKRSEILADSLNSWFRPSLIQQVEREQLRRVKGGYARCKARPKVLDRRKGVISKYDNLFKRYAGAANIDWRLIAAQCYQESSFDPEARSWAGACGLMQLMPATAKDLGLSEAHIFHPTENIRTGIKYMSQLIGKFSDIPSYDERIKFALAAYNGGYHHIRDAMSLAVIDDKDNKSWLVVSTYIRNLSHPRYYTNKVVKYGYMRGSETVDYVNRIMIVWREYTSML